MCLEAWGEGSFKTFSAWGRGVNQVPVGGGLPWGMGEIEGNYGIDLTFSDLIFFVTNSSLLYLLVHDLVMFFHQKYSSFFFFKI